MINLLSFNQINESERQPKKVGYEEFMDRWI